MPLVSHNRSARMNSSPKIPIGCGILRKSPAPQYALSAMQQQEYAPLP